MVITRFPFRCRYLDGNLLTTLPGELGSMPALTSLLAFSLLAVLSFWFPGSDNQLWHVGGWPTTCFRIFLQELDNFPSCLYCESSLVWYWLYCGVLADTFHGFCRRLDWNNFDSFPTCIMNITSLGYVSLDSNKIPSLPAGLAALSQLSNL